MGVPPQEQPWTGPSSSHLLFLPGLQIPQSFGKPILNTNSKRYSRINTPCPVLTKAGPAEKASKFIRPFPELFAGETSSSTKKEKGKHEQSGLQTELVFLGPGFWVKACFKGFKYFRRLKFILVICFWFCFKLIL